MTDRKRENLKAVCRYLPQNLSTFLQLLDSDKTEKLCEIRMRAGKPVVLIFTDERMFITETGRMTEFYSNDLMCFQQETVQSVFNAMCRYSVHSMTDDIAQGFITLEGGNRVGVCGRAVTSSGRVTAVKNISGLNIRISGDFAGCAAPAAELFGAGEIVNVLICGPPSSGKTTVMKDLCRILSDEMRLKVCIADERGETDGCDTGINTDVLFGYPKAAGIQLAVRTLSPEIIAFDEIGTADEIEAVRDGLNSGVSFIMTIHCADRKELVRKPQFSLLKEIGAADYCVFLEKIGKPYKIYSVKELENEDCRSDCFGNMLRPFRSVHRIQAEYESADA